MLCISIHVYGYCLWSVFNTLLLFLLSVGNHEQTNIVNVINQSTRRNKATIILNPFFIVISVIGWFLCWHLATPLSDKTNMKVSCVLLHILKANNRELHSEVDCDLKTERRGDVCCAFCWMKFPILDAGNSDGRLAIFLGAVSCWVVAKCLEKHFQKVFWRSVTKVSTSKIKHTLIQF